jgi:propionyl-CoA carboxylase alpha chain
MKMESGVASPMDGVITEVRVAAEQAVEAGDILIRFKA